jgi:hypothetical protein
MQVELSHDVMRLLLENSVVRLLMYFVTPRYRDSLRDNFTGPPIDDLLKYCHPDVVIRSNIPHFYQRIGRSGWIDLLERCVDSFPFDVCDKMAAGGDVEALEWCISRGYRINEDTCTYAALGGHLETLQYLRSRHCPWDDQVCHAAILRHYSG